MKESGINHKISNDINTLYNAIDNPETEICDLYWGVDKFLYLEKNLNVEKNDTKNINIPVAIFVTSLGRCPSRSYQ